MVWVKDKVYGTFKIDDPILIELLKTPSLLRLKKISQYGIPDKYYHFKNFSRYEHSVGVMLLLRKLGATVEEQVAGILHDVSVLAFSHIADWVFSKGSEGKEDYHDTIHAEFINKTEIPDIIKAHNFSLYRLMDKDNYSLMEKNIPDLCADRVDYSLRESFQWLNPSSVPKCVSGLGNLNGEIIFLNKQSALLFSKNFLNLQKKHWGGAEGVTRYYYFSEAIKIAIKYKVISVQDFYGVEDTIIYNLENSKVPEIQQLLKLLQKKKVSTVNVKGGKKVRKKFRYVNPKVLVGSKLLKLSKITPSFSKLIEIERKKTKKGIIAPEYWSRNA